MRHDRYFVDVAREALLRLAKKGLSPTPDHYSAAWREVIGSPEPMAPAVIPIAAECVPEDCGSCASLAAMLKLTTQFVGSSAVDGGWVQNELQRLMGQVIPPWEAERLRALEGPLREVLGAETAMRSEFANAKAGIKEILATLIGRIGRLQDSTDRFADTVDDYAVRIEQADSVEALSRLAKGLAGDTRTLQGEIVSVREELVQAQERAKGQDARMRDLEHQLALAREQVRTDALTGALNRRGFEEVWDRESSRAERTRAPLAVAVVDLDNFKRLNDTYGHPVGDRALVHLVAVARRIVRPTDHIARLGGEEFAVLLPNADLETAMTVTARLQRSLTRDFFLGDQQRLFITFSAGVAEQRPGEAWSEVLHRADEALYEAKRKGKNRILPAHCAPTAPDAPTAPVAPVAPTAPVTGANAVA